MSILELPTPFPTVDLDAVDRNVARMQAYCDEHGLALRPHVKTHKLPRMARLPIGEVVAIVPNHASGTVNMHDELALHRGGVVRSYLRRKAGAIAPALLPCSAQCPGTTGCVPAVTATSGTSGRGATGGVPGCSRSDPVGTTAFDTADGGPVPTVFVAVTVNV